MTDAGPQPVSLPTGTIAFEATNGFFPSSGSCAPTQTPYSPEIGSCQATFQVPNEFPLGAKFPITATYSGDATFEASSTSHKLIVASCVDTAAKPCKNSIGLDFPEVPQVIQDAIDALIRCGGGKKSSASGMNSNVVVRLAPDKAPCVANSVAEFELAQEFIGLTPDDFRLIAEKITSQQAAENIALQYSRKLATTAADTQLAKRLDPNTPQGQLNGYVVRALKSGTLPSAVRSVHPSKAKREKGNTQKTITLKLSKYAKVFVDTFKATDTTRSDSTKKSKLKGSAEAALD